MIRLRILLPLVALVACGDDKEKCDTEIEVFVDADGDGFGTTSAGKACEAGPNEADQDGDCDDENDQIHPDREERCNGLDDDCDGELDQGFSQVTFYQDLDGDGFGVEETTLTACVSPSPEWVRTSGDCDDVEAGRNPGATEVCGGGDEDCDDLIDGYDDTLDPYTLISWFPDEDLDGFGRPGSFQSACSPPKGPATIDNDLDCDDRDAAVNPDALEICNGLIDDDCDGLLDDLDDSNDPTTLVDFFADTDGDGAGDAATIVQLCAARPGFGVANDLDCDDTNAAMAPNQAEVLCDTFDNDCDALTADDADRDGDGSFTCVDDCNDLDPTIYPGAPETSADLVDSNCDLMEDCYQDVDNDGSRTSVAIAVAGDARCTTLPNVPPFYPVDCDDNDPAVTWSGEWIADLDLDGYGAGGVALNQCIDPGAGYVLGGGGEDCDDNDPSSYPGAPDVCNDGSDSNCDASDVCVSCADWLASDGGLTDGVYSVRPTEAVEVDVYCDMTTDGGGWSLVASTLGLPPVDASIPYHNDLQSLDPLIPRPGVWGGLRSLVPVNADVRFACKLDVLDAAMTVDLSFYDVPWYFEMTTGTDTQSCFNEGGNPDPTPARRNNLTGVTLVAANPYNGGALEGEDTCGDADDFTVDFDDQGMDGDESDGTDWGEDDGKFKCASSNSGDAWFVFVRE